MTDEPENNLQNLWQDQPTEISPMVLADVHARALKFQSHQKLLLTMLGVCAAVSVLLSSFAIYRFDDGLFRLGFVMLMLGMLFILYYRYSHRVTDDGATGSPSRDCFEYYRIALTRRIQLLRTAWLWYFLPALPGLMLVLYRVDQSLIPGHLTHPERAALAHLILIGGEAFLVAAYLFEMAWVWRKIGRLKHELAALEG